MKMAEFILVAEKMFGVLQSKKNKMAKYILGERKKNGLQREEGGFNLHC